MAWTDGVDRAVQFIVTASIWNSLLGAAGSLMQLKSHKHDGTTGEGSTSLGPIAKVTGTDAAAPAAPGAGLTVLYPVAGRWRYRAGAAGADTVIPAAHSDLTGIGTGDHHAQAHTHPGEGAVVVTHASTTGQGVNDHHARDHAAAHQGGADALAVDAAAGTGSLRTLGTGAAQAAAGNHTHTRITEAKDSAGAAASEDVTWTTAFSGTPVVVCSTQASGQTDKGCDVAARSTTAATVQTEGSVAVKSVIAQMAT